MRVDRPTSGDPPTNDHRCSTNAGPPPSRIARTAFALSMADATLSRFRTIPESPISRATSSSP